MGVELSDWFSDPLFGSAILLALGGVLAVGAAWLARRRCPPSELGGDAAGEAKRQRQAQADDPAAAEAQHELAVVGSGGGGGVECCPAAAACTSRSRPTGTAACTAGGSAAERLQFERGWAMKHALRKKKTDQAPERYSQFDLD